MSATELKSKLDEYLENSKPNLDPHVKSELVRQITEILEGAEGASAEKLIKILRPVFSENSLEIALNIQTFAISEKEMVLNEELMQEYVFDSDDSLDNDSAESDAMSIYSLNYAEEYKNLDSFTKSKPSYNNIGTELKVTFDETKEPVLPEALKNFSIFVKLVENFITARPIENSNYLIEEGTYVYNNSGILVGKVLEIFGSVTSPYYLIIANSSIINQGISLEFLYYEKESENTFFVNLEKDIDKKAASDASGVNNGEVYDKSQNN